MKQVVKWQSALILRTTAIVENITMCLRPFCFVCSGTLSAMALTMLPSFRRSSVGTIMYRDILQAMASVAEYKWMCRDLAIPPVGGLDLILVDTEIILCKVHCCSYSTGVVLHWGGTPLGWYSTGAECFPAELDTASFATVHLPCGQPACQAHLAIPGQGQGTHLSSAQDLFFCPLHPQSSPVSSTLRVDSVFPAVRVFREALRRTDRFHIVYMSSPHNPC